MTIPVGKSRVLATQTVPVNPRGLVLFAHGRGSDRHSPRNRYLARALQARGFATLLLDLLTPDDERRDGDSGPLRCDVDFLADRLVAASDWVSRQPETSHLPIGYFGAGIGAAAALIAASRMPDRIRAVVSRGGRPDLAGDCLQNVRCPTLLIVGGADRQVISLNFAAHDRLTILRKRLQIIMGADHLFEETGALEQVAASACDWFEQHLTRLATSPPQAA